MSAPAFERAVSQLRRTYFSKEFLLFVFCGGMGTLTNFLCSLVISSRINPTASYVCGYGIGIFVTYTLNAKIIFHSGLSVSQYIKFVISYLPNFLLLFTFVAIFLNVLHWHKIAVYALAGCLGLPLTFVLVKIFAFKKQAIQMREANHGNI